jgi:hypothetical protein
MPGLSGALLADVRPEGMLVLGWMTGLNGQVLPITAESGNRLFFQ